MRKTLKIGTNAIYSYSNMTIFGVVVKCNDYNITVKWNNFGKCYSNTTIITSNVINKIMTKCYHKIDYDGYCFFINLNYKHVNLYQKLFHQDD